MVNKTSANEKLKDALEIYQENWLSKLPTDDEIEPYEFSPAFKKKMMKLTKAQKKPYYMLVNTAGKRVAVIIVAVLIALSTTVFSVKALRDPLVNFFIDVHESFSRIIFQSDNPAVPALTKVEDYFTPQYIPEGYLLSKKEEFDTVVTYEYHKNGDIITYDQMILNSSNMLIDTEDTFTENITINETIGIFFSNKGYDNIIWNDGVYIYYISGTSELGKDELIRIAESVK